jgi:hypothetical protein
LAPVPDSALHAQAVLALLQVDRHLPGKLRVLRVLRDRQEAVVVNNIRRPKKAR